MTKQTLKAVLQLRKNLETLQKSVEENIIKLTQYNATYNCSALPAHMQSSELPCQLPSHHRHRACMPRHRTPCPGTSFPSHTPYKASKYLCCKLHRNREWSPHFNSVNQPYHMRSPLELLLPTTQLSMAQNVESALSIHVVQPYHMPDPGPQLPITQAPTTLNTESSLATHFALPLALVNCKYCELLSFEY